MSQSLFQVCVEETATRNVIPIGPRQPRDGCEGLVEAINIQIALGRERDWTNPHIVPATVH